METIKDLEFIDSAIRQASVGKPTAIVAAIDPEANEESNVRVHCLFFRSEDAPIIAAALADGYFTINHIETQLKQF